MALTMILGWAILAAVVAFAGYALWRGRGAKPDGFRHRDWMGEPRFPDKSDFPDER
jgi:hypothetical protein